MSEVLDALRQRIAKAAADNAAEIKRKFPGGVLVDTAVYNPETYYNETSRWEAEKCNIPKTEKYK